VLILMPVVAAGCGGGPERERAQALKPPAKDESAPSRSSRAVAVAEPTPCRPGDVRPLVTRTVAYAAAVRLRASAFRAPGNGLLATFRRLNQNGVATVFGVLAARVDGGCRPTWYRVQLPMRPNGITGWVRARDVSVSTVRSRILVDLSERRVTLFAEGRPVLTTAAAIGAPSTPTPTGRYYVNQRLRAPNPTGAFGPGAVGVSAFSPVLRNWPQGGPIAIHGTNSPQNLGFAVSHGCVRVGNADLERLWELAPEGTPVEIRM